METQRFLRRLTALLLVTVLPIQVAFPTEDNTGLNSADVAETVDKGQKSKLTEKLRENAAKDAGSFQMANHLDGFSLWYLLFVSNYLAGASLPVMCKNSELIGAPVLPNQPLVAPDNLIYAFASLIQLFVDYLIFEQNGKRMDKYRMDLTDLKNASASKDIDQKIRQMQVDLIEDQINFLKIKLTSVQATEAGYKVSALMSAASWLLLKEFTMIAATAPLLAIFTGAGIDAAANIGGKQGAAIGVGVAANSASGVAPVTYMNPDLCLPMAGLVGGGVVGSFSSEIMRKHADDLMKGGGPKRPDEILFLKPETLRKWEKLFLIEKAHAVGLETPDPKGDVAGMTDITGDIEAMIKTSENLRTLGKESVLVQDLGAAKDPMDALKILADKFLNKDFFTQYSYHLGFRNGGENAFLAWFATTTDTIFFPGRGWSVGLVQQDPRYNGWAPSKMIHSIVSAFFAEKYSQEVQGYITKLESFRDKLKEVNDNVGGGGATGPSRGKSGLGFGGGGPLDPDESGVCLNGGAPNPASVGKCDPKLASERKTEDFFQDATFQNYLAMPELGVNSAFSSLAEGIDLLSKGKAKEGLGKLGNLAGESAALSRKLRDTLKFLDAKHPEKKVLETLNGITKEMMADYKSLSKHMGLNPSKMLNTNSGAPFFAGFIPLSEQKSGGEKTDDKASIEDLLKGLATMPEDTPTTGSSKRKSSGLSTYSEEDEAQALAQNFDYQDGQEKPDDIDPEAQKDIFKIITIRYFKSAFPRFYKKVDD